MHIHLLTKGYEDIIRCHYDKKLDDTLQGVHLTIIKRWCSSVNFYYLYGNTRHKPKRLGMKLDTL